MTYPKFDCLLFTSFNQIVLKNYLTAKITKGSTKNYKNLYDLIFVFFA